MMSTELEQLQTTLLQTIDRLVSLRVSQAIGGQSATASELRLAAGLTVEELSVATGVSVSAIYRLERGADTNNRRVQANIIKLAGALNVRPDAYSRAVRSSK